MREFIRNTLIIAALFLTGCSSSTRNIQTGNTDSLAGLQSMVNNQKKSSDDISGINKIREMALKETSLSIGAQSGLASRAKYIDNQLIKRARNFDDIFNFNSLILEHNILPPVLLEGQNTFNLANSHTIRLSDKTYKISKQARFITTSPTWRQYLWMDYKSPEYPNVTLLPKTREERQLWNYYIAKGWRNGTEQANTIFEENVARIKEDFNGMILYRKLLALNMVSPPYVSHTDLGITGNDGEIHIDDRVLRITELPALNVNSNEWRAAVSKNEDSLEQFRQMEHLIKKSKIVISSQAWQPVITPAN